MILAQAIGQGCKIQIKKGNGQDMQQIKDDYCCFKAVFVPINLLFYPAQFNGYLARGMGDPVGQPCLKD